MSHRVSGCLSVCRFWRTFVAHMQAATSVGRSMSSEDRRAEPGFAFHMPSQTCRFMRERNPSASYSQGDSVVRLSLLFSASSFLFNLARALSFFDAGNLDVPTELLDSADKARCWTYSKWQRPGAWFAQDSWPESVMRGLHSERPAHETEFCPRTPHPEVA